MEEKRGREREDGREGGGDAVGGHQKAAGASEGYGGRFGSALSTGKKIEERDRGRGR